MQLEYQIFFGCPVYFDQTENALHVKNSHLELPLRQADKILLKTLEDHAQALIYELDTEQPLSLKVRFALKSQLPDGAPRNGVIAKQLSMTSRTMQRKLKQENTSYQQIPDQLRMELACHHLLESSVSVTDIALKLGFSEPRSFHRSFKQWKNSTPGEYRLKAATQDPGES